MGLFPDGSNRPDGRASWFLSQIRRESIRGQTPRDRYAAESRRLLGVLETRLEGRTWIMGVEYTIADKGTLGWVRNLLGFYDEDDLVDYNVPAWLERGLDRPAVERGLNIPAGPTA